MGHILTAGEIKADPEKAREIKNIREPRLVIDIKSFLGSVNYLSRYIPSISQMASWKKTKKAISEETLIVYYDPSKRAVIKCDASGSGL